MFRYIGNFLIKKKKTHNPMTLAQILVKSKSSLFEGKFPRASVIEIEQVDYLIKETVAFRHVYIKCEAKSFDNGETSFPWRKRKINMLH